MKILSKKELYEISGGMDIQMVGDIIIANLHSSASFQLDGYTFSTSEGMKQGGIYNGYQVVFRSSSEWTTFIFTPVSPSR